METTGVKKGNVLAMTGSKVISLLSGMLAAFLILYGGYTLYENIYTQNLAFSSSGDLMEYRPEILEDGGTPLAGGKSLAALNKDYRAWLTIRNTSLDYPVMQGENDLFYASHDVRKKSSLTGSIYLSSGNSADFSDRYNLIFGHHMDNGAMFGALDAFADSAYLEAHREGELIVGDTVYDLTVFASLQTDAYDENVYNVSGRNPEEILGYLKENAGYFNEKTAKGAKRIAAMSTCSGAETNGRFVIFAVMQDRSNPEEEALPGTTDEVPGGDNGGNGGSGGNGGTPDRTSWETPDNIETQNDPDVFLFESPEAQESQETIDPLPGLTEELEELEEMEDEETPLAKFANRFQPTGGSHGIHVWALVNLICLVLTIYMLLPLLHLKAKFGRKNYIEDEKKARRFVLKFRIGVVLEILVCIVSVIAFLWTEDLSLPMALTDRWTPLMIILLLVCWLLDVLLVRFRKKGQKEEEEGQMEEGLAEAAS